MEPNFRFIGPKLFEGRRFQVLGPSDLTPRDLLKPRIWPGERLVVGDELVIVNPDGLYDLECRVVNCDPLRGAHLRVLRVWQSDEVPEAGRVVAGDVGPGLGPPKNAIIGDLYRGYDVRLSGLGGRLEIVRKRDGVVVSFGHTDKAKAVTAIEKNAERWS